MYMEEIRHGLGNHALLSLEAQPFAQPTMLFLLMLIIPSQAHCP